MGELTKQKSDKLTELVSDRRFQDAVKLARLILLSEPQDVDARVLLAQSLMSLARYDEVLAETQIILEIDPERGDAWTLKGEALFFKGDFGHAIHALKKAHEQRPNDKKVQGLIQEIELTRQPGEVTGEASVDTAATKSYPAEEGEELGEDPTEIMEAPPVADAEEEIEEEEEEEKRQEPEAEPEAEVEAEPEAAAERSIADDTEPIDPVSIPDELLAVGDQTAAEELPSALRADIGENEVEEEQSEQKQAEEEKEKEQGEETLERKREPIEGSGPGKIELLDVTDLEEEDEEEETDARGAVMKFVSAEKVVTFEQFGVTTGEITAVKMDPRAADKPDRGSVEFREEKTQSIKKTPSRRGRPGKPVPEVGTERLSQEELAPSGAELEEVVDLFSGPSPKKPDRPGPVVRKSARALEQDEEDELEDAPTTPHLKLDSLPSFVASPPRPPKPPPPTGDRAGASGQRKTPRAPAHGASRGDDPPPPPSKAASPPPPGRPPAPPKASPGGGGVASAGPLRAPSGRGPATSAQPPQRHHTANKPVTRTKAFAAIRKLPFPVSIGIGALALVVVVGVAAGLYYVRHRSEGRVSRQLRKASGLLARGDVEGVRTAFFVYSRLSSKKAARKEAIGGQALAKVMLALQFGTKSGDDPLARARLLLKNPGATDSAMGAAASAGLALASGKTSEAMELADDAVGKHSRSGWVFFMRGVVLKAKGEWQAAANNLKHALELADAPTYWTRLALARLRLTRHSPKRLAEQLRALKKAAPSRAPVQLLFIRGALEECRKAPSCDCSEVKGSLKKLAEPSIEGWRPLQKAWARLLRAKIQLCIGDRGAAEKTLQRLTARPGLHHPDFHEQAASVEMALHLQPKAVKALESLKSKYPSRSTTLLLLAKGYVDSDEPEKAVAELMAVGSESRTACWYRLHAEALLQQEKQSDALATVEMGLRKSPDALSLRITKVKALLAAGNEGKARALSGRLYRAHPQDVSVLLAASEALRASGKLVRAEARLKAALEHDPENPKAHAALGRLLAQMGKWDRAAVHLKRAASIHSSSVRNWLELGKLAYRQGRLHAAVDPIKEVLKKSPDHPQALTLLAKVNVATGRFQRARFLLKKVVPKKRGPHWHLVYGWLLLRQADYAEADRHIATAAKRNSPVRRKGVVLQARSALFQDQLRRMRSVLERVGSKWRSHPEVRFSWGLYWLAEHKARTAFRRFVAARRSCRRWKCPPRLEAVIRAYLGRALFLRGSTSAAIRQFNRALEVDPYCAPAYALQGACFYELEKEQRALDLFHKALKLDKGLAETHYYLGEIYRSKGSKKKAADHFRTYLKLRGFGELASAARAGLQAVQ